MKIKKKAGDGRHTLTYDVGIPVFIIRYNYGKQTGHKTEFMILINKYCIGDRTSKLYSPW